MRRTVWQCYEDTQMMQNSSHRAHLVGKVISTASIPLSRAMEAQQRRTIIHHGGGRRLTRRSIQVLVGLGLLLLEVAKAKDASDVREQRSNSQSLDGLLVVRLQR